MPDDQLAFGWAQPDEAPSKTDLLPRAQTLAKRLRSLAERGVYIGTSSWKYPGWLGQVYNSALYATRGKLSQKRFNDTCLSEYTRVFPTVCGDFAFYQFPTPAFWQRTFDRVPDGFRFSLKVPEDITVEQFPDMPRYGRRAGSENRSFLDASIVEDKLLAPLGPFRDRLGVLVFQFGTFHEGALTDSSRFADRLGLFLDRLPTDCFDFAVEVRNRAFLDQPSQYLDALKAHRVAHCLNSWTRMPSIGEQLDLPDIATTDHVAARFLLRPGRTYKQAVSAFSPYEQVKDPYPEGRDAMRRLLEIFLPQGQKVYVFVNNRLEGNAIETIESVVGAP